MYRWSQAKWRKKDIGSLHFVVDQKKESFPKKKTDPVVIFPEKENKKTCEKLKLCWYFAVIKRYFYRHSHHAEEDMKVIFVAVDKGEIVLFSSFAICEAHEGTNRNYKLLE